VRLQLPLRPGDPASPRRPRRKAARPRHHFRATYLQAWGLTDASVWRFDPQQAGSGALGDLRSHLVDLARYLIGEIAAVSAVTRTFHPGREVDDSFAAIIEFANGTTGTLEASRVATGKKNNLTLEINGSKGSLAFDLERLNELQIDLDGHSFQTVLVTDRSDPF
jgi:predicted dehydrogenase